MKVSILMLVSILISLPCFAQNEKSLTSTDYHTSRGNYFRLVYPSGFLKEDNAQLLLDELDKTPMDLSTLRTWLPANFKRFGLKPDRVKQIAVFAYTEYADCSVCEQQCNGKCAQDQDGSCVCISNSDNNLRVKEGERPVSVILLLDKELGDDGTIDVIVTSYNRTSVKSGKSNSSD